jgi:cyclophilin family peptidyl-prolyl cis-trans isomerase
MPRKMQTVQVKKRQKTYRAGELSGDTAHVKPKGAFRLFTNYKLFAILGVAILGSGFIIGAFYRTNGSSTTKGPNTVRGQGVTKATPEAGSTSVSGASGSIKQYTAPPTQSLDPTKTYTATIKTEKGDVTVQLNAKDAPETVNNFVFLANDHFYDGVTFFRVIPDKDGSLAFAQAGDPTGTGSGGPGYDLPAEKTTDPVAAGVLVMAKPQAAGAPNNGSQFFFALKAVPTLDGKTTVFGKVTSGLEVLTGLTPRDPQTQQNPEPGTRIESITITSS